MAFVAETIQIELNVEVTENTSGINKLMKFKFMFHKNTIFSAIEKYDEYNIYYNIKNIYEYSKLITKRNGLSVFDGAITGRLGPYISDWYFFFFIFAPMTMYGY